MMARTIRVLGATALLFAGAACSDDGSGGTDSQTFCDDVLELIDATTSGAPADPAQRAALADQVRALQESAPSDIASAVDDLVAQADILTSGDVTQFDAAVFGQKFAEISAYASENCNS